MYKYAGSFPVDMIADKAWQDAFARAALNRVEISTAATPEKEVCAKLVKELTAMKNDGTFEAASLHLPYGPFDEINPSALDENLRKSTVKHFSEYIRRFAALEIPLATIHCSGEPNESDQPGRRKRIDQMRRSCEEFMPLLDELDMTLNLELLPRSCIGNIPEELIAMSEDFPENRIGIILDVNHGMDRGKEIPAWIKMCGSRLRALHISDYDNVDECHWQVGEGMLDWGAIIDEIRSAKQDLTVIIEVKHPAIPAHRTYKMDPSYTVLNIERNCMKLEYAHEMNSLLEQIRKHQFQSI